MEEIFAMVGAFACTAMEHCTKVTGRKTKNMEMEYYSLEIENV